MSPSNHGRPVRWLLAVLAAVLGLALGVPVAHAFFIDTDDQAIVVTADTVSDAVALVTRSREPTDAYKGGYAKIAGLQQDGEPIDVAAAHGSERSVAVVLGWRADWAAATEPRSFTLTAKTGLRAVTATVENVGGTPSSDLEATVSAVPDGDGSGPVADGERRQIDLRVRGTFPAGRHRAVVALRLEWADGSFLTKRVPVVWFGGAERPTNADILAELGDDAPALDDLDASSEPERDATPATDEPRIDAQAPADTPADHEDRALSSQEGRSADTGVDPDDAAAAASRGDGTQPELSGLDETGR